MKKILKDRYLYAIVILFLALFVYCYFANNGNNSFMPSYTIMPITDMTINMILFLSIVALCAYRFHIIGGIITGLVSLPIVILLHRNLLPESEVWVEFTLMGASCILTSFVVSKFVDAKKKQDQLIQQLQNALAEVKTLSGLIPICASCKKIRDDKGYWGAVESYISAHSDATFTHGICPDCMKKLYAEYYEQQKDENMP